MNRTDRNEIYKWYDIFIGWKENPLVEIRIKGQGKVLHSGIFDNVESLAEWVERYDTKNVFFTINSLIPDSKHLAQYDKIIEYPEKSIEDNYIESRDWIFIDIDVNRKITNINATDEEAEYALRVAKRVVYYLRGEGLNTPVITFSANGAHLYYRCHLLNTEENTGMINNFLRALGAMFDDDRIKIDTSVSNPSRIAKLPGTMSAKGRSDDTERPQRMCRFLTIPDNILPNDRAIFARIASGVQEPPKQEPTRNNHWGREKFDLREFMQRHGIAIAKEKRTEKGTRFILEHCIFNPEHKAPDAMIFLYDDGHIAYKCFHASCQQHTWKDVRLFFEPDAYDRQERENFDYRRRSSGRTNAPYVIQQETEGKGKKWLSLDEIPTVDPDSLTIIQTGIMELDKLIYGGTILNQLTILTGRPASGKSTFLNTVLLHSVHQDMPVALFSGELPNHLLKSWITLPAAGKHVIQSNRNADAYYVPKNIEPKILEWLKGKLFVHNSEYGNNWIQLKGDIKIAVEQQGAKNIILDNLMTIELDYERDYERAKAQLKLLQDLHDMARHSDVHIWLVAHPRKQANFLRFDDILGASEIGNYADNILIVHRVTQDFENQAKVFFPKGVVDNIMSPKFGGDRYGNVIEIAKNRLPGNHIGELVGVYYDPTNKRMFGDWEHPQNIDEKEPSKGKPFIYGWDESSLAIQTDRSGGIKPNGDFESVPEPYYNQESKEIYDNGQDGDLPF